MKRRIIAFLVTICICCTFILPFSVGAEEVAEVTGTVPLLQTGSVSGQQSFPAEFSVFDLRQSTEQQLYNALLEALQNREKSIQVYDFGVQVSDFERIFEQVVNDNPRLFYVTGGYSGNHISGIMNEIRPTYSDYNETMQQEFDAAIERALSHIDTDLPLVEQALQAHDYLVGLCQYDWETLTTGEVNGEHVGTAYGAFVERNVVCQGYTLAYRILLDELGISSVYALSEDMNHIWNMVQLDGEWYHIDTTWDDYAPNVEGFVKHTYFLISDETIADSDHGHFGWEPLVECTDKKYESGYVFNNAKQPFHYRDDKMYYISNNRVYYGNLTGTSAQMVGTLTDSYGPVVWHEDNLYFVGITDYWQPYGLEIRCFDLKTGTVSAVSEEFTFTGTKSPDNAFSADYDAPGLRVSLDETRLEIVSSTRREVVFDVELPDTPSAWEREELEEDESVRPVGIEQTDSGLTAGVLVSEEMDGSCVLWVAFYKDGRLVDIRSAQLSAGEQQLQVVDLGVTVKANWDECRLMVTGDSVNMIPSCAALNVAAENQ